MHWALGGQWGNSSHNTAPTASTGLTTPRRGHAFEKRYEPFRRLCQVGPRDHGRRSCGSRRARKPGPVGQDRTAVVGAFGVPSVACEKAGNEGPVLARSRSSKRRARRPLPRGERTRGQERSGFLLLTQGDMADLRCHCHKGALILVSANLVGHDPNLY